MAMSGGNAGGPNTNSNNEAVKPDFRWKPLREGEMSPYKILVALFMREVYSVPPGSGVEGRRSHNHSHGDRTVSKNTLLLIYKLITAYDVDTFAELKAVLEKPGNGVRSDVLKKFNRIVTNLEPHNSYFLYEVANSLVTMESSQMVVLKKKVSRTSPFGKYLRGIYLNVKKLSFPQVEFMYKQLLQFLNIKSTRNEAPSPATHHHRKGSKETATPRPLLQGLDLFQKLQKREQQTGGLKLELFDNYLMEYQKMNGTLSSSETKRFQLKEKERQDKLQLILEKQKSLRNTWDNADGGHSHSHRATVHTKQGKERRTSPCLFSTEDDDDEEGGMPLLRGRTRNSPLNSSNDSVKRVTRSSSSPVLKEKRTSKKRSTSLRRIYLSSPKPLQRPSSSPSARLVEVEISSAHSSPSRSTRSLTAKERLESSGASSSETSSITCRSPPLVSGDKSTAEVINTGAITVWRERYVTPSKSYNYPDHVRQRNDYAEYSQDYVLGSSAIDVSNDHDHDIVMRSPSPRKPKIDSLLTPVEVHSPRMCRKISTPKACLERIEELRKEIVHKRLLQQQQLQCSPATSTPKPGKAKRQELQSKMDKGKSKTVRMFKNNSGWKVIKCWSRKQIERAIKSLLSRLYSANCAVPSPEEITQFVRLALTNPSSQVLYPHLHYLEYINSLRIRDISGCTDSLRASFDVRIRPGTAELTKGTTYAAYNSSLLYHQLKYKADARSSLDEAFRAGHAANDTLCLHHCHNLWSSFNSKAYTDAIVTVTKEVDNNMAYLHSLNVIVNAFDVHSRGSPPDEVLHSLWHYNADCDLEEMEGLLLSALCNFFTIFGWHEITAVLSQVILLSNWKWSSRFYAHSLCSLSQSLLFHGDVEPATQIMAYGESVFGLDTTEAGQSFILQNAIFKALRCYLANERVPDNVICTMSVLDEFETVYWAAYNMMIERSFQDAIFLLDTFLATLDEKCSKQSFLKTDLRLRCLLLLAELHTFCKSPALAISHLSSALEAAKTVHSDVYITLCLTSIAAVQLDIGLKNISVVTISKEIRATIRTGIPWVKVRMSVVKAKIDMAVEERISVKKKEELLRKLVEADEFYTKLGNNYRRQEIQELKTNLLERCASQLEEDSGDGKRPMKLSVNKNYV